jgi:hypothetical protein
MVGHQPAKVLVLFSSFSKQLMPNPKSNFMSPGQHDNLHFYALSSQRSILKRNLFSPSP